jgi:hypothetical protein
MHLDMERAKAGDDPLEERRVFALPLLEHEPERDTEPRKARISKLMRSGASTLLM